MRRIDGIVGNRYDNPDLEDQVAAHEDAGTLERVVLDATKRRKSRLRVETDAGTDLGVLVDRPELREGDILFLDDDRAAIVTFRSREVYVVELPDPTSDAMAAAVELGHRVGNQHWDIAIDGGLVYVPLEADRHIVEAVVGDYVPEDASTYYDEVDATLFIDDEPQDQGHEAIDVDQEPEHDHGMGVHHHDSGSHEHGHGHDHSHE
ncbi:urease accessory protein UreE [Haloarchaeobius amylolyticus]|uniref:Urease accessory protein UreE n=1 Tax=Haloarchaeobius amylolyticus TaxID=1198296 RepID=A0ABD6BE11_9EURY